MKDEVPIDKVVASKPESALHGTVCRCVLLLLLMISMPALLPSQTAQAAKRPGAEPIPQPAIPAILAAFDRYEVVAMPEGHGLKDLDDFILALIRNPSFAEKVNDIEVECGNSLYQPILDRYIAGEDVPLTDVRKVWRNTTQLMCGHSGFFEQFFPVVRAINQKLPPANRLRVLAGDPPVDWEQVKTFQDILKLPHRDLSIASVMEKEVLSRHRKALMLFGTFHLFHGVEHNAVSLYEKDYPNLTFVISDLAFFNTNSVSLSSDSFAAWPVPSLARLQGTWLGRLDLSYFFPPGIMIDKECRVHYEFPKELQKPMEDLADAVLYLGPPDLELKEQMPADVALDFNYRKELQRRQGLPGMPAELPKTLGQENDQIMQEDENPLFLASQPKPPDPNHPDPALQRALQNCLELKKDNSKPQ